LRAIARQLKDGKEMKREKMWKQKRSSFAIITCAFLLSGVVALVTSVIYSSTVLAFVGLSLLFWGALVLFVRPTRYVKAIVLDSILSSLAPIEQMLTDLNYQGKAIYLPPRYFNSIKGGAMFVPFERKLVIPPEEVVAKGKVFLENPKGICLIPPGLGLANLYEEELGKNFVKVDLNYLRSNLPKLLVEDLEIAEDLEISVESDVICVRIEKPLYIDVPEYAQKVPKSFNIIDHPLSSSIACALARAIGKPIFIEKKGFSNDRKTLEVYYHIMED